MALDFGRGFDVMKATFQAHHFPPHAHDTYVVEVVEFGVDEFQCGAETCRATCGDIVVISPGEVHTGRPGPNGPLSYRSLYPRGELMADIVEQVHGRRWEPRFRSPVITDISLAQQIVALHREIETNCEAALLEERLFDVLEQLVRRHAITDQKLISVEPHTIAVRRALQLLHDPNYQSTSLEELSAAAGLSPYHFNRMFKLQTGLPPHQYHLNVRLERGRQLLREGCPIAEAAARTGFADQSHFTRGFRRFFGVTPGRYTTARLFKTSRTALQ